MRQGTNKISERKGPTIVKSYKNLELELSFREIDIVTTDLETTRSLIEHARQRLNPQMKVHQIGLYKYRLFEIMSPVDRDLATWLKDTLGLNGWEPYAKYIYRRRPDFDHTDVSCFRKELESE